MRLAALATMLLPTLAYAQNGQWQDAEICSAGVATYFFLKEQPSYRGQSGPWHSFTSARGNNYDCRVGQEHIIFRWVNSDAGQMSSQSTRFQISGSELIVTTDMDERSFLHR